MYSSCWLEPVARAVAWRTHGLLRRTVPVVRAEIASGVAGAAALAMRMLTEPTVK